MIKTLHITSIIAVVLAAGLFVFPVVFGFRGDERVEKFLTAPSVLDQFRKNAGHTTRAGSDETSPLVAQAGVYGFILDPPEPVVAKDPRPGPTKTPTVRDLPKSIKPKFKVIATSYNTSRPEESLALIDEPGKGLHWVRQADIVGNLTIEVQNGSVLAKAGTRAETIAVPHKPRMSLIAGQSEVPIPAETSTPTVTPVLRKGNRGKGSVNRPRVGKTGNTGAEATASPTMNEEDIETLEEQKAMAEKIFAELEAMTGTKSDKTSSAGNPAAAEDGAAGAKGTGITGTEADNIGDLGRELENVQLSPSDRAKQLKQRRAERSKKLRERIEKSRRTRK